MITTNPRQILIFAAILDLTGLLLSVLILAALRDLPITAAQWPGVIITICIYITSGWLLGTYTVLRLPQLSILRLMQRLTSNGVGTLATVLLIKSIFKIDASLWAFHRSTQLTWIAMSITWSLATRLSLRESFSQEKMPILAYLDSDEEADKLEHEWGTTPGRYQINKLSIDQIVELQKNMVLAVSRAHRQDPTIADNWLPLEQHDPRELTITTPLNLAEQQLERLPPKLIGKTWLNYNEIPIGTTFSIERQLKRFADITLSLAIIATTFPLLAIAGFLIYLEDGGPIFYTQLRTGWLDQPFTLLKLRTMRVPSRVERPNWTRHRDHRITSIGSWLRRTRIDELPQLINVIKGDMSLIGPRPEQHELEIILSREIPHYRKRHWMRPGLSGWAQVSAPYAASVKDSELKLSYDLYYLKNFSIWLDMIIAMRTIKTILKLSGR